MTRAHLPSFALALGLLGLAGCSNGELQRNFGLTRDAPDEFVVTTRAPLEVPPDFNLRPPQPGASRPQEQSNTDQAEAALAPAAVLAPAAASSPGQQAFLAAAGAPAPPGVRAQIDAEAAKEANSRSLTDRLLFWKAPAATGTLVDQDKEAQRLRENAALGRSTDTGDTPTISDKPKTIFDWLF